MSSTGSTPSAAWTRSSPTTTNAAARMSLTTWRSQTMGPGATRRLSTIASRPYGARSAGCSGFRPSLDLARPDPDGRKHGRGNMVEEDPRVALRREAEELLCRLRGLPDDDTVRAGQAFVKVARSAREFATLSKVAEAVSRQAPKDSTTRRYYAQALIETGHATVAVDVLRPLLKDKQESAEAYGLIGRAYKQIF